MKILVDGDLLVYKAGFGAQSQGRHIPTGYSCHNVDSLIKSYITYLEKYCTIGEVTIYLTNDKGRNYRYEHQKSIEYKGNRKDMEKPIHYSEMRDHLVKKYNAIVADNEEADDLLGIEAAKDPYNSLVVSADKDLNMVPGWHWKLDESTPPFYVDEIGHLQLVRSKGKKVKLIGSGLYWFYAQCLLGDRVDNIPGVKGYGDVKVYKLLRNIPSGDLYKTVLNLYIEEGLSKEDLQEHALMLWIRQKPEELWQSPE